MKEVLRRVKSAYSLMKVVGECESSSRQWHKAIENRDASVLSPGDQEKLKAYSESVVLVDVLLVVPDDIYEFISQWYSDYCTIVRNREPHTYLPSRLIRIGRTTTDVPCKWEVVTDPRHLGRKKFIESMDAALGIERTVPEFTAKKSPKKKLF